MHSMYWRLSKDRRRALGRLDGGKLRFDVIPGEPSVGGVVLVLHV